MYPFFELFGKSISTYWLSAMLGLVLALVLTLMRRRARCFSASTEDVILIVLCATMGAVIGAKMFQIIGYIIRDGRSAGFWTVEHWKQLMPGVGVFYGGLIGGFVAVLIYMYRSKLDFREVTDLLVPPVLLFHAFGRIGCFLAGCCYGHEAVWGIAFVHSNIAPNRVPLIPVQLFEAGFNLLFLVTLLVSRPERKCPGVLLPLYLMVYAISRFVLEFFRGDVGRGVYLLSTSQWVSLLIFPIGIMLLVWVKQKLNFSDPKELEEA
ncbi:MAG: prolipoprotein diacylglyceryl transferase [Oscillospiraceae bacterium]|jgi:phosphatidylglycerol:prolipoprotein diacylglycerol transferase|nr:prolipoprotein diacylglyceryl transferase [Oscillospiraceae bacterium]